MEVQALKVAILYEIQSVSHMKVGLSFLVNKIRYSLRQPHIHSLSKSDASVNRNLVDQQIALFDMSKEHQVAWGALDFDKIELWIDISAKLYYLACRCGSVNRYFINFFALE